MTQTTVQPSHGSPQPGDVLASTRSLSGREVHLWPVRTAAPHAVVRCFESFLSPDEIERADRFRFEHLRHAFILARGILRALVGSYLGVSPVTIRFVYGPKGKPALAGPPCLDFNVSHAGQLAVFAFTLGCEIGVDVEPIRSLPDLQNVADRFFSADEANDLMSLAPQLRPRSFFLCWTRKEAFIKALGEGLSAPLDSFRVSRRDGEPARLVSIADKALASLPWTLHDLELTPSHAAALVYRDQARPILAFPVLDPGAFLP